MHNYKLQINNLDNSKVNASKCIHNITCHYSVLTPHFAFPLFYLTIPRFLCHSPSLSISYLPLSSLISPFSFPSLSLILSHTLLPCSSSSPFLSLTPSFPFTLCHPLLPCLLVLPLFLYFNPFPSFPPPSPPPLFLILSHLQP